MSIESSCLIFGGYMIISSKIDKKKDNHLILRVVFG
ncbi:MAG: hypothetical protein ACJASR_002453 [Psychroserpens sp.]|jgi:hypothetical protein